MKRVLVVIGTRPEAVKLAPVVHALEARGVTVDVCLTGQHGDILDCCLKSLEISVAYRLSCLGESLPSKIALMTDGISHIFGDFQFDAVAVVGDTISALAGALAGYYADIPVAHVEAGLRTHEREPWPEEMTRVLIDRMACWHFAPTEGAKSNLLSEEILLNRLFVTGNPVVDSLRKLGIERVTPSEERRMVLVTLHRRENWEQMGQYAEAIRALARFHPDITFIWPVHPNPLIQQSVKACCADTENVNLIEPMAYDDFLHCLASAVLVITDSGGVQEEAATIGVPSIVARKCTERPEAVDLGVSKLANSPEQLLYDAHRILQWPSLLTPMEKPGNTFGDGHAGERIAEIMVENLVTISPETFFPAKQPKPIHRCCRGGACKC